MRIYFTTSRRPDAQKDMKLRLTREALELVLALQDSQIEAYGGTIAEARIWMETQLKTADPAGKYGPSAAQKRDMADREKFSKAVTTPVWGGCQVGRATMGDAD